MQVYAATTIDGRDRRALERMCRYLFRPPFAQDAVKSLPDGRVRIRFKHPTSAGDTCADITRDTFIARLAALVPPPRFNLARYYGILSGRHRLRPSVIPDFCDTEPRQLSLLEKRNRLELTFLPGPGRSNKPERSPPRDSSPSRIGWAKLLARVFAIDIERCPNCPGSLKPIEAVTDPDKIAMLLHGARPPPRPPPPGQLMLFDPKTPARAS